MTRWSHRPQRGHRSTPRRSRQSSCCRVWRPSEWPSQVRRRSTPAAARWMLLRFCFRHRNNLGFNAFRSYVRYRGDTHRIRRGALRRCRQRVNTLRGDPFAVAPSTGPAGACPSAFNAGSSVASEPPGTIASAAASGATVVVPVPNSHANGFNTKSRTGAGWRIQGQLDSGRDVRRGAGGRRRHRGGTLLRRHGRKCPDQHTQRIRHRPSKRRQLHDTNLGPDSVRLDRRHRKTAHQDARRRDSATGCERVSWDLPPDQRT